MSKPPQALETLVKSLPPDVRGEVRRFIAFLVSRTRPRSRREPTFEWAGALADKGADQSSVDLQHKASEWRVAEP
jgi:hypothetical protein